MFSTTGTNGAMRRACGFAAVAMRLWRTSYGMCAGSLSSALFNNQYTQPCDCWTPVDPQSKSNDWKNPCRSAHLLQIQTRITAPAPPPALAAAGSRCRRGPADHNHHFWTLLFVKIEGIAVPCALCRCAPFAIVLCLSGAWAGMMPPRPPPLTSAGRLHLGRALCPIARPQAPCPSAVQLATGNWPGPVTML